eukprot:244347_1
MEAFQEYIMEMRRLPTPPWIWKCAFLAIQMSGLYIVFALKSNHFKKMFMKIGFDVEKVDEAQLNIFKATSTIRAVKQSIWALFQLNYGIPWYFMVAWPLFEILTDIGTISAYAKYKNNNIGSQKWMNSIRLVLFGVGTVMESGHDFLLAQFKASISNKGKIFTQGFSQYIAYPNYSGYCLWRTGHALLSGNILYASMISGFFYSMFIFGSIPEKEEYLVTKYGTQYQTYIDNTDKLIPGLY